MKLLNCLLSLLLAFLLLSNAAAAAEPITVLVNGQTVTFDVQPYIDENNRTLVPVRFIVEELGAEVSWDDPTDTVTIEHQEDTIKLVIGESKATVNGSTVTFDTAAEIRNGRTMVPVRFISETLGANVEWEAVSNTVVVKTAEYSKQFDGLNWQQKVAKELAMEMQREIHPDIVFSTRKETGYVYYPLDTGNVYLTANEVLFALSVEKRGKIEDQIIEKVLQEFFPDNYKKVITLFQDTWDKGTHHNEVLGGKTIDIYKYDDGSVTIRIRGVHP